MAEGGALFGPGVAERLMGSFTDPRRRLEPAFPELTDREPEVLELVARGSNKQVNAEALSISSKTDSNHLSNIYIKLQVADWAEAMLRARQAGLGKEPPAQRSPELHLTRQEAARRQPLSRFGISTALGRGGIA